MNKDLISIVIVTYNSFHFLESCLKTIKKYLGDINHEIIVVDNNSIELGFDELTNKYENTITLKNTKNYGFAKANNQGVKVANGEYILLLNSDTELLDNSLVEILKFIKNSKNPIIAAAQLLNSDLTHQPSAYKFPSIWRVISSNFFFEKLFKKINLFNKFYLGIENRTSSLSVDSVIGAFMLMKKSTFIDLGGFDENFFFYHEDTDLCYRLAKSGGQTIYFPQYSLIHIGGGTANSIKWFQLKNKVIARHKFFYKNYSFLYYLVVFSIEFSGNLIRAIIYFILGLLTFNREKMELAYYYFRTLFLTRKSK